MTEVIQKETIYGSVRHQGLAVTGLEIRLFSQNNANNMSGQSPSDKPVSKVITDGKGSFEFEVGKGIYCLQAIPREDSRLLKQSVFDIEVDGASTKCDITLRPGTLLHGKVVTKSGDVVNSGEVFAIGIEPSPFWSFSKVDSKGRFNLVLPKGKFHLGSRSTYLGAAIDDRSYYYINKQVNSIDLYRDSEYELVLPKMHRFQGLVTDPKGNPVQQARVTFTPKDIEESPVYNEMDFKADCHTNQDGKFQIFLESGIYDLDLVPSQASRQFGISQTDLRVSESQENKYILEEGHKLSGKILFKDEPLENVLVRIQAKEGDREFIAESNHEGEFAASIPPGIYKLLVAHDTKKKAGSDRSNDLELAPWTKEIVVGGDTHVSIKLKAGLVLQGLVTDDSGNPRSGIKVLAFSQTKANAEALNEENLGRALAQTTTDESGRYLLSLAKGSYWLVIHKDFESAQRVDIEDESKEVNISWHGWCQLGFSVEGEDDSKIPRCKVVYSPYSLSNEESSNNISPIENPVELPSGYVITDRHGKCRLTLPAGIYSFEFLPPLAGSYDQKQIRQLSIINDLEKTISLPRKKH